MKIHDEQLDLAVTADKAVPDVHINRAVNLPAGNLICHLTQGFDASTYPNGQSNAITAAAHMPVTPGPGESITSWDFGFVQLGRAKMHGTYYAGRMTQEGSIAILTHIPPALPSPILYDAIGSPPDPWFVAPANTFVNGKVNPGWGDHPSMRVPLKMANSGRSNVGNFLFQMILDREFWTILTATDPAGKINYIAHFHWQVRYDIELMWRGGTPSLRRNKSFAKVLEPKVKGAPTDPDLATLLASPSGPRANTVYGKAVTQSFLGARGANHTERDTWFMTVPQDFWS